MSSNTVIATGRLVEAATITAVSEAAAGNMGVINLKHVQPRRRWRATSLSGIDVTFDLAAAMVATGITSYQLIALPYVSATPAATFEVFTDTTQGGLASSGTADYYSGSLPVWRDTDTPRIARQHVWLWLPAPRTDSWVRIKITDAANPAGYVDVGNAIIDLGYNPTLPLVPASPMAGVQEEVREVVTSVGVRHRQRRPRPRTRSFTLQAVGDSARAEFEDNVLALEELRGVSESVFVLLDHSPTSRAQNVALYGLMDRLSTVHLGDPWHRYDCQIDITELL